MSQTRFAELVGAAGKAVVYQWESRKRCPSPLFWRRIEELCPLGAVLIRLRAAHPAESGAWDVTPRGAKLRGQR